MARVNAGSTFEQDLGGQGDHAAADLMHRIHPSAHARDGAAAVAQDRLLAEERIPPELESAVFMLAGGNAEATSRIKRELHAHAERGLPRTGMPALTWRILKIVHESPEGNLRRFDLLADADKIPSDANHLANHGRLGVKASPGIWAIDLGSNQLVLRRKEADAGDELFEIAALFLLAWIMFSLVGILAYS